MGAAAVGAPAAAAAAAAVARRPRWRRRRGDAGMRALMGGAPMGAAPVTGACADWKSRTSSTTRAHLTQTKFASLPISPLTVRAILEVMRYEVLTAVQAQTLPVILQGFDVIAKAKTGTGKTMGFLLPTVELLLKPYSGPPGVRALAVSPTRELASQIGEEAEQLLTFHKPALSCKVVFGGTNVKSDIAVLRRPPSLLVGTPGRLVDLMFDQGLGSLFHNLAALIFDEADQLLEMGFRPSITKILQALQPCALTRQTLLFSATMPGDVLQVAQIATRKGAATKLIDTVGEETSTNTQVDQHVTLTTMANQPAELLALVGQLTAERPFKLVVFFVTARLTQLYAEAFNALGVHVLEMHSRKSQPQRTKCAEQFREGDNLILFTSDVSARGMDYPDVTAVVQVDAVGQGAVHPSPRPHGAPGRRARLPSTTSSPSSSRSLTYP